MCAMVDDLFLFVFGVLRYFYARGTFGRTPRDRAVIRRKFDEYPDLFWRDIPILLAAAGLIGIVVEVVRWIRAV